MQESPTSELQAYMYEVNFEGSKKKDSADTREILHKIQSTATYI